MIRILLIEDNEQLRDITARILSKAGYDVRAAESGVLGIRAWREHGADLVLTDIQIAGMDGFEVVNEIRAAVPDLPVILMSGDAKAGADLQRNTQQLRSVKFLAKPFLRTELLAIVRDALNVRADPPNPIEAP